MFMPRISDRIGMAWFVLAAGLGGNGVVRRAWGVVLALIIQKCAMGATRAMRYPIEARSDLL